jgi:hypothetical protein
MESPQRIPKADYYRRIEKDIEEFIDYGKQPVDLGNGLRKISMGSGDIIYWIEKDSIIQIGMELESRPQGLVVRLVGKRPGIKRSPYASDLYKAVLSDTREDVKMLSDQTLTDEGSKIWKRLFSEPGYAITVYDPLASGATYHTLHSLSEFDEFFGDDAEYKRYQFILSHPDFVAETRSFFHVRRFRELSGQGVDDW